MFKSSSSHQDGVALPPEHRIDQQSPMGAPQPPPPPPPPIPRTMQSIKAPIIHCPVNIPSFNTTLYENNKDDDSAYIVRPTTAGLLHGTSLSPLPGQQAYVMNAAHNFNDQLKARQLAMLNQYERPDNLSIDEKIEQRKSMKNSRNCSPSSCDDKYTLNEQVTKQLNARFEKLQRTVESQQFSKPPDCVFPSPKFIEQTTEKPFNYVPSVASSIDRGKLDLNQIKSPTIKRRLLNNLEENVETHQTSGMIARPIDIGNSNVKIIKVEPVDLKHNSIEERDTSAINIQYQKQPIFWRQISDVRQQTISPDDDRNYRDICQSPAFKTLELLNERLDAELAMLQLNSNGYSTLV